MTNTDDVELQTTATTAGRLLRQARMSQGMHIATLASAIKVPQRKLEMLEADQWSELPDIAFARALAQTVCRTLKLDSSQVMHLLPAAQTHRIEQLGEGLNAPFFERSSQIDPPLWSRFRHPAAIGSFFLLFASAVFFIIPPHWFHAPFKLLQADDAVQPSAVSEPAGLAPEAQALPSAVSPSAVDAQALFPAPLPADQSVLASDTPLELRVTSPTFLEVADGIGNRVLSRWVQPGSPVFVGGVPPLRLKVSNVAATDVRFRGRPIDLGPVTAGNVAYLELH